MDYLSKARYKYFYVFSVNTGHQTSIGTSPFEFVYGLPAILPVDKLFPWPDDKHFNRRVFEKGRSDRRRRSRFLLLVAQQKQKANYDKRRLPPQNFERNDLVLVRRLAAKPGIPRKFQPRYVGPFIIIHRLSNNSYQVGDLPCNRDDRRWRIFSAHSAQLKKWSLPCSAGDDDDFSTDDESIEDTDVNGSTREADDESTDDIAGVPQPLDIDPQPPPSV